jgi:hypothetical protein
VEQKAIDLEATTLLPPIPKHEDAPLEDHCRLIPKLNAKEALGATMPTRSDFTRPPSCVQCENINEHGDKLISQKTLIPQVTYGNV